MRKRVTTTEFVKRLRGSVSQILISDLVRASFAPRSDLIKYSPSRPSPEWFWKDCPIVCSCLLSAAAAASSASWSAAAAAWSAWSAAAAAVAACAAAFGQVDERVGRHEV